MMRRHPPRASHSRLAAPPEPTNMIYRYDSDMNPSRPTRSSPLGSSADTGLPLELLDRLKAFPLFQKAPESFLISIGRSLRPNVYQPAQEIVREGEDAKAMYWLVRGSVMVRSRDGESTYAELKPGAFFGEIGILMDIPRTASIVANSRSLVVRLNKEDLQNELPSYPEVERVIRHEALERLAILKRKKTTEVDKSQVASSMTSRASAGARKRLRDSADDDVEMTEAGSGQDNAFMANKRRKSPSPGVADTAGVTSALDTTPLTVRQLLTELPLFSGLPAEILHFLGINAQPKKYPPFTDIIEQGSVGRDVFFIVSGEVEVLTRAQDSKNLTTQDEDGCICDADKHNSRQITRARLKNGQYFGEVTSLSLAPRRTATVRSISTVECLLISGGTLDDLWRRCSPELKHQVESEALRRMKAAKKDEDIIMVDQGTTGTGGISTTSIIDGESKDDSNDWRKDLPQVSLDGPLFDDKTNLQSTQVLPMGPIDPDPFFNADLDNMRARSRRSSLAPPLPPADGALTPIADQTRTPSPPTVRLIPPSPLKPIVSRRSFSASPVTASPTTPHRASPTSTRRPSLDRQLSEYLQGTFPDAVLLRIFTYLDLADIMILRRVSMRWNNLLTTSHDILEHLDLSIYNRQITDAVLRDVIAPFVGSRPKYVDMSMCFHITDDGFKALSQACGASVKVWKMKSVWDVTAPAVLELVDMAKGMEEIDLSNCRKVGDNLLARLVGWVVPEQKPGQPPMSPPQLPTNGKRTGSGAVVLAVKPPPALPPPGTVIGASKLKHLTLSYCKHVQDRSMAHIAVHAAERLESLDLTRCTSISDAGFHAWNGANFHALRKLVLADCTYLSDQAIVGVVGGCRGLTELDLSFCCALSDTATQVLSLGLPGLRKLDMAFCGSAVSDNSLRCIGLHLLELRHLSVRGCVRVTGNGVESVVDGCRHLSVFDVSQCKNLQPWLDRGGVQRVNAPQRGRRIRFDVVADGTWRSSAR